MVTPDPKRVAVAQVCEAHDVNQRRACTVLQVDRSSVCYRSRRPNDDERRARIVNRRTKLARLFTARIRSIAVERRRFGYRRIHLMLMRQGVHMNQKKLRRLYGEEKLQANAAPHLLSRSPVADAARLKVVCRG